MNEKFKRLRFGTSGLRDTVENMSDMECYINTRGFIAYLEKTGEFKAGSAVALGGDRRPSTPRIKGAVAAAIRDMGGKADDQGLTISQALASYAMKRGIPGVMVTGSHIPADRNGIKFTKRSGEVLKSDEEDILASVAGERNKVNATPSHGLLFDEKGMFNSGAADDAMALLKGDEYEGEAVSEYIDRYVDVFGGSFLKGAEVFLYQHSAVGRDTVKTIFERLGAEVMAPESLRSSEFVPVDTESVSSETMAVFRKTMNEKALDIGISLDGDSDRPLLVYRVYRNGKPTDEVKYVTGDILGLLTVLGLEEMGVRINAAAVPVSANDAIAEVFINKGVELMQTKIGSPYVIAAMNESLKNHAGVSWNVFSWESNGGFLTGSDLDINHKTLKALPTRDAVLPLLCVIRMANARGIPISDLINKLSGRFTCADRKKEFPVEKSKAVIQFISPAQEQDVSQVDFNEDGTALVTYLNGNARKFDTGSEFHDIKEKLQSVFTGKHGFSGIKGINYIDGVRIFFSNGEISHLRPSGNAPEFRNYAIADTPKRAKEIVAIGLEKVIPALAEKVRGSSGQ